MPINGKQRICGDVRQFGYPIRAYVIDEIRAQTHRPNTKGTMLSVLMSVRVPKTKVGSFSINSRQCQDEKGNTRNMSKFIRDRTTMMVVLAPKTNITFRRLQCLEKKQSMTFVELTQAL